MPVDDQAQAPETPESPVTAGESAPQTPVVSPTDAIVDRWFSVAFPGSPIVTSTEAWNWLTARKDELKDLLNRETRT